MRKVYLLGFRGLGFTEDVKSEPALIRAGHVGWQLEGDERIFGFHPTNAAIEAAGGEEAALLLLKDHNTLNGAVQIDNSVFEYAAQLAISLDTQNAERIPWVWQQIIEISDEDFEHVRSQTELWYTQQKTAQYGFPDRKHGVDVNNCATFPKAMGIPIPESTGQLRFYIPQLQALGELWKGKTT